MNRILRLESQLGRRRAEERGGRETEQHRQRDGDSGDSKIPEGKRRSKILAELKVGRVDQTEATGPCNVNQVTWDILLPA